MEERKLRILFYDIETSPILGYVWGIWQQDVIAVKSDWQILSVAWKWLGEKRVHCLGQDDLPGYRPGENNDKELVKVIHGLFDEADIVVAHNGNSFDQKKCQARMMIHGMDPPSPYKQIDTKLVAKRYAAFTSNKLKFLAQDLKVSQKGDAGGFDTWLGCLEGNKKSWKTIKNYNKQDIPPLEEIYLNLRPWISNHPNIARITDSPNGCPKCGSTKGFIRRGFAHTSTGKAQRYKCKNCAGWCQGRTKLGKDEDVRPNYVNISN